MASPRMKNYLALALALLSAAVVWEYRSDFLEIGFIAKEKNSQLAKACE